MEKKNWIIAGVCFALVIVCIGGFFFMQNMDKQENGDKEKEILDSIVLEFNDIKTLEYGSDFSTGSLIKKGEAEVSFDEVDTSKVGSQTIKFVVTKEGVSKTFEYTIEVKDTKAPLITLTKDKETLTYGKAFDMKTYIKSVEDEVDGKLIYREAKDIQEGDAGYYTYTGEVNTKKAGTYKVRVTAVDIHNNKSEKEFTVTVSEEKKAETPSTGTSGGTNNTPSTPEKPYVPNPNNKVIVVNAGHQGKSNTGKEAVGPNSSTMKTKVSSGATGVSTKIPESQTTLNIALKLRTELQAKGYTVVMTRTTQGVNISNKERAEIGNNNNAAAVISLHCDGTSNSSTRGAHTIAVPTNSPYCPQIAKASQSLANKVISAYCSETGIKNRGVSLRNDLTGLNWSTVPAIYIEMGFISNATEDKLLNDSAFQTKCAKGIAKGIDNYCR